MKCIVIGILLLLLSSCSGLTDSEQKKIRKMNATGEHIYRSQHEYLFPIDAPKKRTREEYPWEEANIGNQQKITKEFFRCKGSHNHPPIMQHLHGDSMPVSDCGGIDQHSLPLQDGKEFIYPALLDLINYVQKETQKKVIVTCGHRCPTHNTYADSSPFNANSKHMIGAEVDFYVKGMEWSPEEIVNLLKKYYKEHPRFHNNEQFTKFVRFEKGTNVSTLPWYNKEIFIKVFKKDEGRDFDNDHRYPYICIQLKWDRDANVPVTYSWSKAFNGFLRY